MITNRVDRQALRDIDDIRTDICENDEDAAERVVEHITRRIELLKPTPTSDRRQPGMKSRFSTRRDIPIASISLAMQPS